MQNIFNASYLYKNTYEYTKYIRNIYTKRININPMYNKCIALVLEISQVLVFFFFYVFRFLCMCNLIAKCPLLFIRWQNSLYTATTLS